MLCVCLCSVWCHGVLARTGVEIVESSVVCVCAVYGVRVCWPGQVMRLWNHQLLVCVCVCVQWMMSGCVGQDKVGNCGVISYCCVCVCAVHGVRVSWPGQVEIVESSVTVVCVCVCAVDDVKVCWPGQVWRLWSQQLLLCVCLCSGCCQGVLAKTSVEIVESSATVVCVFVQCMVPGCVGQGKCGICGVISLCVCVCSACQGVLARTSVEIVESSVTVVCVFVQCVVSGCVGHGVGPGDIYPGQVFGDRGVHPAG